MSDWTATKTGTGAERQLPQIGESTRVNDVFRQLSQKEVGGFLLVSEGRSPRPVGGVALATAMLELDPAERLRSGGMTVGEVLQRQRSAFTREDILLNTSPPIFKCENTPPHENQEWNDGYCGQCPYRLASAE